VTDPCVQSSRQVVICLQEEELRACTFKPHTKKLPAYISRMAASHRSRKHIHAMQPDRTSMDGDTSTISAAMLEL
jgi:hypothetical protein